ncbi:MAG: hypothetical protein ABFD49_01845 [Armatimonadota bacterium]|nr:hypothetical protein [bacterium]
MGEITEQQARQVWAEAQEKVKDRVIAPTLYRALEVAVGITVENGQFILGFSSADAPMAGHLRSAQHLAIIEQSISEVLKQKVRLKTIDGTTLADYEAIKKLAQARDAKAETVSAQRAQDRQVEQAWEEVAEKITRGYAKLQQRQFAQNRAQFIRWGLGIIHEGVVKLGYTEQSSDAQKRGLARTFEKFATSVNMPSAWLAYEYYKLREDGKLK